ncbi:MAG: hypothetical protein PHE60_03365 [Sulfurospirillaceae bacterium]|nr:hypothetical protein [Sulfurospirillaceae bacterium]
MLKPISTQFFNRAISFLEVALISSKEKDNVYFNTAEYSNVTAYLVYHATELFLKFAIFQASNESVRGHEIFTLYKEYKKYYQDDKWDINIPFCKPEDVDYCNFTKDKIEQLKARYSMSFEQQLKYPIDDKGVTYNPITIYDTELLEKYKSELLDLYFQIEEQS